jgi:6-pyruvoyltetrahydropterin/6-carboxytetrahydropterin synthase
MAIVYINRKEHFSAAHKLFNPAWTKEKNEAVFGPCANENWHGHNFELEVTIKGTPDPETGFVYDLKKLGDIVKTHIINVVDHKNLNLDVPFLVGKLTSTENFAIEIWKILEPIIELNVEARLHRVKLVETNKNSVEYFGE